MLLWLFTIMVGWALLYSGNYGLLIWSISIGETPIRFFLLLDGIGCSLFSLVCFITSNIYWFRLTYISADKQAPWIAFLISLFLLSIGIVIICPSLLSILLGWDGLGLFSFLLILHYPTPKATGSAMLTASSMRIGDGLLILSLCYSLLRFESLIWCKDPYPVLILLAIIAASFTKSATLPFSSWLPAAMVAPTPVSALVHSSTLVTAGIILLLRFYPLFKHNYTCMLTVYLVAWTTLIYSRASAITSLDVKTLLAISTIRHISLILFCLRVSLPTIALLHLISHAFFKSLLFISAGTLIFQQRHAQDLRLLSSSHSLLTQTTLSTSTIGLCGLPFLVGYYSKHLIAARTLESTCPLFYSLFFLLIISTSRAYSLTLHSLLLSHSPCSLTLISKPTWYLPYAILTISAISLGAGLLWIFRAPVTVIPRAIIASYSPIAMIIGILLFLNTKIWPHSLLHWSASIAFLKPLSTQYTLFFPLNYSLIANTLLDKRWLETFSGPGTYYLSSQINSTTYGPAVPLYLTALLFPVSVLAFLSLNCSPSLKKALVL